MFWWFPFSLSQLSQAPVSFFFPSALCSISSHQDRFMLPTSFGCVFSHWSMADWSGVNVFFFRENWAFLSQNLWAVNSSLARGGISYCSPFSMVLFSFAQVFCTVNCTTLWVHLCNCPDVSRRHRFWAAIHCLCLLHSVFHLLCYDTRVSGGASQHICSA